jgi:hypothetical protein
MRLVILNRRRRMRGADLFFVWAMLTTSIAGGCVAVTLLMALVRIMIAQVAA